MDPAGDGCCHPSREEFVHFDDPILDSIEDVISPEAVARGEPIRATDAQLVFWQLMLALDRAIKAEGGDQHRGGEWKLPRRNDA